MSTYSDTLDISPLRPHRADLPIAEVQQESQTANHPEAAAIARARIAALPENPLLDPDGITAVPTAELVVDRNVLAGQLATVPAPLRHKLPPWARSVLTFAGIFVVLLLLFKLPVIWSQVGYLGGDKPVATAPASAPVAASVIPAEPTITIPKINVHAPTVYEPSVVEANVQKALEGGIVHYGNTPAPGQGGNSVYFGHSSNDWWEPGNFKFVFVLLDKLAPGDRFTIDYESKRYTYEVTGSRVVLPTDLSVLTPTAEPTVSLITCTPPGTSWKRLVVTAKQVDPDPSKVAAAAKPQGTSAKDANLPGAAPSFTDQLGQAWNGIVHGFSSLFGADSSKDSGAKPGQTPAGQLPAVK